MYVHVCEFHGGRLAMVFRSQHFVRSMRKDIDLTLSGDITLSIIGSAQNDVTLHIRKRGCPIVSLLLIVASLCIFCTCMNMATQRPNGA